MSEKLTFQETKVICDRCKNEVSNLYVIHFLDVPEIDFKGFAICRHCTRKALLGEP